MSVDHIFTALTFTELYGLVVRSVDPALLHDAAPLAPNLPVTE